MTKIVGVLLPLPFNDVFDYKAEDDVAVGDLVAVSFGNPRRGKEELVGVVWKIGKSSHLDESKIKPVKARLDYPPLSEVYQFYGRLQYGFSRFGFEDGVERQSRF